MASEKIKVLIADSIDLSGLSILPASKFAVTIRPGITNKNILDDHSEYQVLLIRSTRIIDRSFISKCALKVIATCSKGTDHIDVKRAEQKGIKVLNVVSGNNISAAEHTIALILASAKNLLLSSTLVSQNRFSYYDYKRTELAGKTIGIIGYGKVGNIVGNLSKAFGMNIIANDIDPNVKNRHNDILFKNLDHIFKQSDIVTIHVPLTSRTKGFIDLKKLGSLKSDAILINTSRGDVIDEKNLIKMLKAGKIRYAGIDVYKNEPDIDPKLLELNNVFLTNHIAGKTEESQRKMSEMIFKDIADLYI